MGDPINFHRMNVDFLELSLGEYVDAQMTKFICQANASLEIMEIKNQILILGLTVNPREKLYLENVNVPMIRYFYLANAMIDQDQYFQLIQLAQSQTFMANNHLRRFSEIIMARITTKTIEDGVHNMFHCKEELLPILKTELVPHSLIFLIQDIFPMNILLWIIFQKEVDIKSQWLLSFGGNF